MKMITKHKRGFFGWIFLLLFWGFQTLMIAIAVATIYATAQTAAEHSDAAWQAGAAIGGSLMAVTGWFVWMLGTVILGIPVLATRGKSVTVLPTSYPTLQPSTRKHEPSLF